MKHPTHDDPLVASLSEVVGGPVGSRWRPHSWWTPVRVLLAVFSVVFCLGLVQKYPCGQTQWSTSVRYSKMCYSDVPYLYTDRGFAEHRWPYADDAARKTLHGPDRYPAMEYPPLTSYVAWIASEVTSWMPSGPSAALRASTPVASIADLPGMGRERTTYFLVTAGLLFLCGLGAVYFLAGASPGRPWDAMGLAASPVLLAAGLVNWELVAVLFSAGALWAWARGRPVLAGVMIGLGVATKLYPLFLLLAFLVDAFRRRRPEWFGLAAVGAVGAWVLVNLPAVLSNATAWKAFWSFDAGGDYLGSFWTILRLQSASPGVRVVNVVSVVLVVLACAAVVAFALAARKRPGVAQVALLLVGVFLLVNKVYSPQYVLWLLPFAALAHPRWRDLLVWQACELFYFGVVWLYLGGWLAPSSGSNPTAYEIAILVRLAGLVYLMTRVAIEVWTAEPDETEWLPEVS